MLLVASLTSFAHDFEVDGIYYNILSKRDLTCDVTYKGLSPTSKAYSGNVVIPSQVLYDNKTYCVTSIRDRAFSRCTGLTSITIPNSVTSIGGGAFYGCTGLTSVVFNAKRCETMGSTSIPVFQGCENLKEIIIGNEVELIPSLAFRDCSGLTSITIPNSVTSIGGGAFSGCTGLTSVTIGNSVTSIGKSAFWDCTGLTSITIPNSVTSIGDAAFEYCTGLTSVTIGNSVTSIGEGAFKDCSGLTSITIPNSVTSIGEGAFKDCSGLTSITIPNSVTSIGVAAFSGCSGLTLIIVDADNQYYDSRDNSNAIIEKSTNTLVVGCKNTTIPNSVTSIGKYAFEDCTGLTSITIPNSVTSIGKSAFSGCKGLTSITIGNSVTSIGYYAFLGCTGLTDVTCLATTPPTVSSGFSQYGTLHVLPGCKAAYEVAEVWERFTIVEDATDGIESITADAHAADARKFLQNGRILIRKAGKTYNAAGVEL